MWRIGQDLLMTHSRVALGSLPWCLAPLACPRRAAWVNSQHGSSLLPVQVIGKQGRGHGASRAQYYMSSSVTAATFHRNRMSLWSPACTKGRRIRLHLFLRLSLTYLFRLHLVACGILIPPPGIEPSPPALEGQVSTTGSPGKSPRLPLLRGEILKNIRHILKPL